MSKTFSMLTFTQVAAVTLSLAALAMRQAAAQEAVHVHVNGVETEAQLAQQLQAQGYADVALTTQRPNSWDPHPELHAAEDPQTTTVQLGWSGTATKEGHTVNVYVDPQPTQSASGD